MRERDGSNNVGQASRLPRQARRLSYVYGITPLANVAICVAVNALV